MYQLKLISHSQSNSTGKVETELKECATFIRVADSSIIQSFKTDRDFKPTAGQFRLGYDSWLTITIFALSCAKLTALVFIF